MSRGCASQELPIPSNLGKSFALWNFVVSLDTAGVVHGLFMTLCVPVPEEEFIYLKYVLEEHVKGSKEALSIPSRRPLGHILANWQN